MKGIGGLGNMGKMMKQAQSQLEDMQNKMAQLDENLKERVVEGSAGGGMVKVVFNGLGEPLDVKIDETILDEDDPEFLQEMILAAIRQGIKKAKELEDAEKKKIAGGLPIPGMENML